MVIAEKVGNLCFVHAQCLVFVQYVVLAIEHLILLQGVAMSFIAHVCLYYHCRETTSHGATILPIVNYLPVF